jgi:hypothetical protein
MGKKKQHGGKREGAGRPVGPDGPTKTVAATVPESLVEALDAYAQQQSLNRSEAITQAIRGLLAKSKRSTKD